MLPNPGEFVCYFPMGATIEQPGVDGSIADEYNRYRSDTLKDLLQTAKFLQTSDAVQNPLIRGIGYWGTEHDLNKPIEYENDKYCRVFSPHLGYGIDVYERELIAHLSAASDSELEDTESYAAQIHDISLESVSLEPDLHMGISILLGVDQPQNGGSEEVDQQKNAEYLSKISDWVIEHRSEILAGLVSNTAMEAAGYVMGDNRQTGPENGDIEKS